MSNKIKNNETEVLRKDIISLLMDLKLDGEILRDQVANLILINNKLRDISSSLVVPPGNNSAKGRILEYFKKHPKTIINSNELMMISGISEYARRIRELRVEDGWIILSGKTLKDMVISGDISFDDIALNNFDELRVDSYLLLRNSPDEDTSHRWENINKIRKSKVSVKNKILDYLRRNVGKAVTGEELRYVANEKKEWARRVRELRTEDGWPVLTRNSGRLDLPIGAYLLEDDRQAKIHDRKIPDKVRVSVLERDHHSCQECFWTIYKKQPHDPRKFLELHHIEHHKDGGKNTASNLITLCNVCHDEIHNSKLKS